MDIPKALCDVLVDALDQFILYRAQTLYHFFGTIWVGLTYVGLGLGPILDSWTIHIYIYIYTHTHTLAYEHALMHVLRGSSIFFFFLGKKLIICIHYNLGLLHFPITKKT